MHFFLLAALLLTLAAACSLTRARRAAREDPPHPEEDARALAAQRLEESDTLDRLGTVIEMLRTVMDHPQLGGPGFLSIQFPPSAGSLPTVTAQFPNINESLYRSIIRQELDQAALAEAGVPEELFSYSPSFSTESGGMVLISAEARGMAPALERLLAGRRERAGAMIALAQALEDRYPDLSIRVLGAELMLTPVREPAGRL